MKVHSRIQEENESVESQKECEEEATPFQENDIGKYAWKEREGWRKIITFSFEFWNPP